MNSKTKKIRVGVVVSDKMDKTVIVAVERRSLDSVFKKYLNRKSKIKAHDEKNECKIGDQVQIVESRPLSKEKRWRVQKIVQSSVS